MRKFNIVFIIYFSMLFLLITCAQVGKQSKNINKPIKTGFVFIDGKYIKSPYLVETRDFAIYINGLQAKSKHLIINEYAFDHDPGMPPNVTKDMMLGEVLSILEPSRNIPYITAKLWYLFSHFIYDKAFEKAIQYYENLPNVKSLTHIPGNPWVLESYSGEKRNIVFGGPQMRRMNAIWGPEGSGPPEEELVVKMVNKQFKRYVNGLKNGDAFFIFSKYTERSFREKQGFKVLREMMDIMKETLSKEDKINELISIGFLSRNATQKNNFFVSNYSISSQLEKRLESLAEYLEKKYGDDIYEPLERYRDIKAMKEKENYLKNK